MSATIRRYRDADLDRVVAFSLNAWEPVFESFQRILGHHIFLALYPDWRAKQAKAVSEACRGERNETWVAIVDHRPVGFVTTQIERDDGINGAGIYMIAVDPEHQRHRIGSALLSHAVAQLQAQGVELVGIETGGDPGHAPARAMYEKHGFRAIPLATYYLRLEPPAAPR